MEFLDFLTDSNLIEITDEEKSIDLDLAFAEKQQN